MKRKIRCKSLNNNYCKFDLKTVFKVYSLYDIARFILFMGPITIILRGSSNLHPMFTNDRKSVHNSSNREYVLYQANRTYLSEVEHTMLDNVEEQCGKEYRSQLPLIWEDVQTHLTYTLQLISVIGFLPVLTGLLYIIFHKKEHIARYIILLRIVIELGLEFGAVFASWYILDSRLCFFGAFSSGYNILGIYLSSIVLAVFTERIGLLCVLYLYLKNNVKRASQIYISPSPSEELKTYIKELREAGITSIAHVDLPKDPKQTSYTFIHKQIKRSLQEVRIQMAQLHRDDPLVKELLASGRLGQTASANVLQTEKRSLEATSSDTDLFQMPRKSSEYKLLTHHHHKHSSYLQGESRDDVEIILPEPGSRDDLT